VVAKGRMRPLSIPCLLVTAWLLAGCEAPLDLAGIEHEKSQVVHRFDQLQAAAWNGQAVVAVGSGGAVVVSRDGALNWTRLDLAGRPHLIDIAACPDGTLIALDPLRRLWVSNDHGSRWEGRDIATQEEVMALTCDPLNRVWVVGGFTTILSSADTGRSWSEVSLGDDAQLTTVQFLDAESAVITGEFGMFLTSSDGGANWERTADLPNEFYPHAAYFIDRSRGWIVGLNGAVLYSEDGGLTWARQPTPIKTPLYGLARQGEQTYAVGDNGVLLRLADERWVQVEHGKPARTYLREALPLDGRGLLLVGGAGALFRIDTGELAPLESELDRERNR